MNRIPDNWPPHREAEIAAVPFVLAHEIPFFIGSLYVEPALRRVVRDGGAETIVEPLVMQVLVALARARGDILTRDELVDRCWGGRIVGDDSISRVIALVRKLGAGFGEGAFTVETITKVGYRMLVAGADGTRRDKDEAASSRTSFKVRGRLAGLVAGAGLAAATAAVWAFALPGDAARAQTKIGVEPVLSSRNDRESQRFASDLPADLARLAGASSRVNMIDAGPARSRERLDLLVRISVEGAGRRLGATARLVDAHDGAVLWSRSFVDESGVPSRLREQVALDTAVVMRCGLERSAKTLGDQTLVRLLFTACESCQGDDWQRGQIYARKIISERPDAAVGWALLAMSSVLAVSEDDHDPHSAELLRHAAGYARKAITLDPHSGSAYKALALAYGVRDPRRLRILEQGIGADPEQPELQYAYSMTLYNLGYVRASVAAALRVLALDPASRPAHELAVRRLLSAGRTDEAIAMQARTERLWPGHPEVLKHRLRLLPYDRDPKTALAILDGGEVDEAMVPPLARQVLRWRADPAGFAASSMDREADAKFADEPNIAWHIVRAMHLTGRDERAFAWLERAPRQGAMFQWSVLFAPESAGLRRDPRFFKAMAELGLVDLWGKLGRWPDFCAEPGLRYDCRTEAARLGKATRT